MQRAPMYMVLGFDNFVRFIHLTLVCFNDLRMGIEQLQCHRVAAKMKGNACVTLKEHSCVCSHIREASSILLLECNLMTDLTPHPPGPCSFPSFHEFDKPLKCYSLFTCSCMLLACLRYPQPCFISVITYCA